MSRSSRHVRSARKPRVAIAAAALFATSAVACSALLGFEDRTLGDPLGGQEAGGDTSPLGDGAPRDVIANDAPPGSPSPPLDVTVAPVAPIGNVTTLAGSGTATFTDGTGALASFNHPYGVTVAGNGNIFLADGDNNRIRQITPQGIVTTLAGSTMGAWVDDTGSAARFNIPGGLAIDATGTTLYVPEFLNNRVRKVTVPGGVVTTLAGDDMGAWVDGPKAIARLNQPLAVGVDSAGNTYVADYANNRIRKITAAGDISTVAGSGAADFAEGIGEQASFNSPAGIVVVGGNLYVSDTGNNRVRKIVIATREVTTFAGSGAATFADGTGTAAGIAKPTGIAVHVATGDFYFNDSGNAKVRRITPAGVVTTLAGDLDGYADGLGTAALFRSLQGIAVSAVGEVYIADYNNHRVRQMTVLGVGRLAVSWATPAAPGTSDIVSYTATATAAGRPPRSCTAQAAASKCTISGLTTAVTYSVTVTATNGAGTGPASSPGSGLPN